MRETSGPAKGSATSATKQIAGSTSLLPAESAVTPPAMITVRIRIQLSLCPAWGFFFQPVGGSTSGQG